MSTFKEIIARVDERKPNSFSQRTKLQWLTALDGRIAADVLLMDIAEIRALPHGFPGAMDAEPLVGYPHDDLYDFWLEAKIHAANEEYSKYQNVMELYNESYNNFVRWFCGVYQPAKGGYTCRNDVPTWFITAYGLAVKRGYRGSVDEWLASLKGEMGETGKSAYQYAVEAGYTGTEEAFRESQLNNGKTAYEYAVEGGYSGTVAEFRQKMAQEYAPQNHDHDGIYAKEDHDHDDTYAKESHDHDGVYAREDHNHDGVYAKEDHGHDGGYLKVDTGVIAEPVILKRGLHYGTEGERPAEPVEGQTFWKLTPGEGGNVAATVVGQAYGASSMSEYSSANAAYAGYNGSQYYGYILKFVTGELSSDSDSLLFTILAKKGVGTAAKLRYALCTSDANKAAYMGTNGEVADDSRIASGTVTFAELGSDPTENSFAVAVSGLESNTTYYLYLWAAGDTGTSIQNISSHSAVVALADGTMRLSMEIFQGGDWLTLS